MVFYFKGICHIILYTTMISVPGKTYCPEHTFTVNSIPEQFTWPESPSSDVWIASDCLDQEKKLIFRQCVDDVWIPNNIVVESLCKEKMNTTVLICPEKFFTVPKQSSSSRNLCYKHVPVVDTTDDTICMAKRLSFMELNMEEKKNLLTTLTAFMGSQVTFIQEGRNRWPNTPMSSLINYNNQDIELQDTRCGRFGLPLIFSKNTVNITCGNEGECENMCLSLTVTKEPFSANVTVEQCVAWALFIFTYPFLHNPGCSKGYYRVEYPDLWFYPPFVCYSIQMFPQPITIMDIENVNVQSFCNTNSYGSIMSLTKINDMFVFRQLSDLIRLTNENHCLFSLTSNEIIKYSDWDSIDLSQIDPMNFNWDQSMNYSRVANELSYLTVKPNGKWKWAVDTVSCIVCKEEIVPPTPRVKLGLQYRFFDRKLELNAASSDFWYREKESDPGFICFALIGEEYKTNLTVLPIPGTNLGLNNKYLVENVGVGQYWCSGHDLQATNFFSSTTVYAFGIVFSFQVARQCNSDCLFSHKDLKTFIEALEQNFNFLLIEESAFVEHESDECAREYKFTVQLSLAIKDKATIKLDTNLTNLTDYQIETVFIYEQLNKLFAADVDTYNSCFTEYPKLYHIDTSEIIVQSIKSTEFCLHESTLSIDAIIWRIAYMGEVISPSLLCSNDETYSKLTRTCNSDSLRGLYWEEMVNVSHCYSFVSESLLKLYVNISTYPDRTIEVVDSLSSILQINNENLLPLDVFLTSRILKKASIVIFNDLENIFSIFNSLMQIDERYLKISSALNSTNILLEALDEILLNHINCCILGSSNYTEDGKASFHSHLLKTFVVNPKISGFSGVALYRSRNSFTSDDDFENYSSRYVFPNETIDDVITEWNPVNDLVVSSYFPTNMLKRLKNSNIAFTIFFNDKLFQNNEVQSEKSSFQISGKVISITIIGVTDRSTLPIDIPIFFESSLTLGDNTSCAYWEFSSINGWSTNGCNLRKIFTNDFQHITVCDCTHLTHFGCVISDRSNGFLKNHDRILTIITIIGSSSSILGTGGIFITAVIFEKWRQKLSSKILMNFAAAITLEMILMIFTNIDNCLLAAVSTNQILCVAVGSILHYSILAMHLWMLIIAYFQFKRYVVVFNFSASHLLLKSSLFAWLTPLLPVITILITDHSLYLPKNEDEQKFCYPNGLALYIGVIAPIAVIFLFDSIVYLSILVSLNKGLSRSTCINEVNRYRLRISQIRLFAFLFFTLGMTWSFGLLSNIHPNFDLVFSYLFCISATIQGLILFLYFVVLDPNVRALWLKFFRSNILHE